MGWFPSLVTFLILWWTVLFAVLPLGAREADAGATPGADAGAPAHANMPRKFLLTTGIAFALWLVVFLVVTFNLISLDDLAFGPFRDM